MESSRQYHGIWGSGVGGKRSCPGSTEIIMNGCMGEEGRNKSTALGRGRAEYSDKQNNGDI